MRVARISIVGSSTVRLAAQILKASFLSRSVPRSISTQTSVSSDKPRHDLTAPLVKSLARRIESAYFKMSFLP